MGRVKAVRGAILIAALHGLWGCDRTADIRTATDKIKDSYGVEVHTRLDLAAAMPDNWLEPRQAAAQAMEKAEIRRILPLVRQFLGSYPRAILRENLRDIYLYRAMSFNNKPYGGTHWLKGKAIYLCSDGKRKNYTDEYLLGTLHAEFSSILLDEHPFPVALWEAANPPGFLYRSSGFEVLGKNDLLQEDPGLLQRGFLVPYSQVEFEEDLNEWARYLWSRPRHTCELARLYPRLKKKGGLAVAYYKQLGVNNPEWNCW